MQTHIVSVTCFKQAQKNKGIKNPTEPSLLRRRRIVLIYIKFLLCRKAYNLNSPNSYILDMLPRIPPWHGVQRPAVKDVFLCAIEELRSNSSAQKNVAEQNRAEGEARTRFCGA